MADETDDIIVSVEGEAPQKEEAKPEQKVEKQEAQPQKSSADEAVESLKNQFNTLRSQLGQTQQATRAAQTDAQAARAEAERFRTELISSRYDTILSGMSAAQAEADSAEREYQAAFEAGDAAKAAQAQRKLAAAVSKQTRFEEAKLELDEAKTRVTGDDVSRVAPQHQEQQARPAVDPVEQYIQGRTQLTADWLRAHRDWISDPKKNAKLTAAHYNAEAEGLVADTPEYFDSVERFIGLKQAENTQGKGNGGQQQQRRQGAPAAPVAGAGGNAGGGIEVRLTKGEAESANDGTIVWGAHDLAAGRIKDKSQIGQPIGNREMARRKHEMNKEGRYDKVYYEQ